MSLRPIEAQGSFPISPKTGKIQDQLQQRAHVSHHVLTEHQKAEDKRKRKQVNESEGKEQIRLRDDGENRHNSNQKKQNQKEEEKEAVGEQADHPFKGKFIDFSG
ncbi:hypothetical protein N0O92_02075 [Alkalihalobacillus sp. MEB130]|uniref:hypothetical protein n=1 Tax=Alkalihalobacillus sp. MEB130 TaxID=2976704 RepID=UPI0028DD70A9|nr:hypothetical protein [Alkalihalobacillus sp. MEB130]MDT8859001.1 hypothetical protein [Alkalihalobacillus sp. MEB130]